MKRKSIEIYKAYFSVNDIDKIAQQIFFWAIFILKRSFFQKTLDKQKDFEYNNTIEPKPMIQKSS